MHLTIFVLIIINLTLTTSKVVRRKEISYCIVTQEDFPDHFDFTKLTNNTIDYKIEHEKDDFLTLQLCKPLKNSCNSLRGYAVCYSKNGKEYAIGKEPPQVNSVKFGETIFRYTGDQCDNNNNYTVNIKMICDFSDKKSDDILWFPTEYNQCDFNLEWRTNHACAKRSLSNCTVDYKSQHYDLRSLINYANNYEVKINETYTVVLNVCHSILYRPNSCKSDTAACLVINGTEIPRNLGTLAGNLKYDEENKTLSLTYKDGGVCNTQSDNYHIQTTITFICNQNAIGTLPIYVGGMENCHYKFNWITAAACSEQVLEKKSLEESHQSICSVKNPVTNFLYNFTSLMNKAFSVHSFGITEIYEFSICGPVINTSCTNGTGTCKIRNNMSGGMGNSNLLWKETGPYLNYTNGSPCGNGIKKMYTIIEFYCNNIENYDIDERPDLCYNIIKVTTELACLESPKSCVTADKEIDLNPLKLRSSNYEIKTGDSDVYINVCRPLVREEETNCPDEVAICKLTRKNGITYPISLGLSNKNPTRSTDRSAVLIYNGGSTCEEDKGKKLKSSISFVCDVKKEKGIPAFLHYKNCTYFFEWKTAVACGKINGQLDKKTCLISNNLGDVQSLSFLKEVMSPQYVVNKSKTYNISLCGFNDCNGGFICANNVIYGTNVNIVFDYTVNSIQINFTQGTKCADGSKAKSSITLVCNQLNSLAKPVIIREEPCNIEFEWPTSKICQRQNNNMNKTQPQSSESGSLSGGQIVGIIFAVFLILIAIIYSTRRWHLVDLITHSRHCDHVRYSRVNTEEEVHLLLDASDPNVIETDSDNDLLQA
ncbi:cation-independent mannose-6-phosphate receptor [Phymastichus coffea]|uniref:cation-independent mannose-6-phosphate receptor n=1 Tax=Phymastichus coffea TaxID=108790 RepID=UPI00273A78A9|nr:cation-independent mannose-6-phosphate receptor [Phymastichus coffea]XP_058803564.1 cation-independent mannose-6-phosphate receptor [Phymastichus coffea]